MHFPFVMRRYVGTVPPGQAALGSDTVPTGTSTLVNADALMSYAPLDTSGVVVNAIALFIKTPAVPPTFKVDILFWEEQLQEWVSARQGGDDVTANTLLFLGLPNFVRASLGAKQGAGAPAFFIQITPDTTPPNGEYVIVAAPLINFSSNF